MNFAPEYLSKDVCLVSTWHTETVRSGVFSAYKRLGFPELKSVFAVMEPSIYLGVLLLIDIFASPVKLWVGKGTASKCRFFSVENFVNNKLSSILESGMTCLLLASMKLWEANRLVISKVTPRLLYNSCLSVRSLLKCLRREVIEPQSQLPPSPIPWMFFLLTVTLIVSLD